MSLIIIMMMVRHEFLLNWRHMPREFSRPEATETRNSQCKIVNGHMWLFAFELKLKFTISGHV